MLESVTEMLAWELQTEAAPCRLGSELITGSDALLR